MISADKFILILAVLASFGGIIAPRHAVPREVWGLSMMIVCMRVALIPWWPLA